MKNSSVAKRLADKAGFNLTFETHYGKPRTWVLRDRQKRAYVKALDLHDHILALTKEEFTDRFLFRPSRHGKMDPGLKYRWPC